MTLLPVITFYLFAAVIVGSALLVITRRNSIVSAMFLALSLVAVAGLYVSLRAEFLFAVQVLVYTGGVMVLFLFVIMLVNIDELVKVRSIIRQAWLPLAMLCFAFGTLVWKALEDGGQPLSAAPEPLLGGTLPPMGNVRAVSTALLTGYLLPFEVVSVLLLVAMVGAIVLSKKEV